MPSEFEKNPDKYLVPFCKRRKNQSFRSYGVGLHQINITSGVLELQITFNKIESRIIWESAGALELATVLHVVVRKKDDHNKKLAI